MASVIVLLPPNKGLENKIESPSNNRNIDEYRYYIIGYRTYLTTQRETVGATFQSLLRSLFI